MKKIYLCAMALSVGSLSFGQALNGKSFAQDNAQLSEYNGTVTSSANSTNKAPGDVIFSEDFTGGMPAGWSVVDNTANNRVWVINDQDIWNSATSTVTPSGYTNATAIASTSGGNHMLLWGDEYNRVQLANTGSADDMDSYFQTAGIPLNGEVGVSVEFQQKFRRCCANAGITVNLVASLDPAFGAGNFSTYNINAGVQTNDASADPLNMSINVSDIAGNAPVNSMLYLRWHVGAGSSHYYWMIDDIKVVESPINDMVATKGYYGFFGVELTRVPVSQRQPMDVSMIYDNIGMADQTGTHLSVDVTGGAGHSATSTPFTAMSLTSDTLSIDSSWTPPASPLNTDYTVTLAITSDSTDLTPANNGVVFPPFQVTSGLMAMDDFAATPGNGGGNSGPNNVTEYEAGNQYDIVNQDEDLYAIDVVTGPNTPVGTFIDVVIYQIDFSASPEGYTEVWRSAGYAITAADLGAVHHFNDVPGTAVATLTAGETYFVAVHSYVDYEYGVSGNNPSAGTPSARHSAIRYPNMVSPNANSSFGLSNVPMIRLNFDALVGVNTEVEATSFSVFPNPSNGEFTINLEGDAKTAAIAVKNVVGQTIINKTVNVAGKTTETISLSDYSKGVYFLTVDGETTKLIVE